MKSYFLVLCLLVATVSAGTTFDDELREVFEFVKQQMPCGFSSLRIPRLAPYKNDFLTFDFNDQGVNFVGNLTNLSVEGLNDFDITQLTYAIIYMRMRFDFTIKQIKVSSQYKAQGGLQAFGWPLPFVGDGDLNLLLENVRLQGSFNLRPTTKNGLKMYSFRSNLELGNVKSTSTGVMNSVFFTKFFNEFVEEFFRMLFDENPDEINQAVRNFFVPKANEVLKEGSILEAFGLALGFGPNSDVLPVCVV